MTCDLPLLFNYNLRDIFSYELLEDNGNDNSIIENNDRINGNYNRNNDEIKQNTFGTKFL